MKLFHCLFLATAILSSGCAAESKLTKNNAFTEVALNSIEHTKFNGVILLNYDGANVVTAHVGYADAQKQIPLNETHIFSPGSVGKEFTTVSIMQLVQQGKLNYQDKISDLIDGLPSAAKNVTIEHILSHTSGFPGIKWKESIDTEDVTTQLKSSTPKFAPGEGYMYSNLNVALRALVIEKVTEAPYADFLQTHIFEIAGMTDSFSQTTKQDARAGMVPGDYPTYINGVTIYVTPRDLMKFEQALSTGRLVPMSEIKRMLPGDILSGKQNRAYFDFGKYQMNDKGALASWEHDGSNPSHHTLKYHDFAHDYTLVLMSSDGNKSTLYKIRDEIRSFITNLN